jgi:hypothetical protein
MSRSTLVRSGSALLAIGALVAATACGGGDDGDGSSGGSTEAFCDEFAALADTDAEAAADPDLLRNIADAAPDEISGAMDRFVEIAEELETFDEEEASEEDVDGFFTMLEDLEESSTEIEQFLVDNCPDLPPGIVGEE